MVMPYPYGLVVGHDNTLWRAPMVSLCQCGQRSDPFHPLRREFRPVSEDIVLSYLEHPCFPVPVSSMGMYPHRVMVVSVWPWTFHPGEYLSTLGIYCIRHHSKASPAVQQYLSEDKSYLVKTFTKEESEYRWRCAEWGNMILLHFFQNVIGVNFVVVNEYDGQTTTVRRVFPQTALPQPVSAMVRWILSSLRLCQ